MHPGLRAVQIVLIVVGVAALVVGIVYFALPAHSLPHFLPDHAAHSKKHAIRHGIAAVAVGAVFLIAAACVPLFARRTT